MNEYQLFDLVYILSTKDVSWLSAPRGSPSSPKGYWCITAIRRDGKFVLTKEDTTIITTMANIKKVANYDLQRVFNKIKNAGIIKKEKDDGDEEKS